MGRLEGKVAAITGGASGIGAGTVRRFVEEGAKVLIADLDQTKGDALASELGAATAFLRTDVSKEEDVAAMVAETTDRFGRIDVLFNNAGFGGTLGPIESTSLADYDLTMDVLLKSVFLGMKHVAPMLKAQRSGSIISTASVAGIRAGYAPHLYSVAKSAVIQLTKTVALELGEHGIRVNAICPGFIATPLAVGRPDADESQIDQLRASGAASQVLGRVGKPRDIANMALFLASDDSEWITGREFVVDGGFEAGPRQWSRWPKFRAWSGRSAITARPIVEHAMNVDDIPELIHGRTWEEMPVGFAFRTSGRTITESDLVSFIGLTGLSEGLFYDARNASDHGYTGRLVPGMQTFCYAEGLVIQTGCIHGTGLAHMHCEIDIKAPVYVGDTIVVVVEVIAQRATAKGSRGVITTRNTVYNQRGDAVMVYEPVRLVKGSGT